MPDETMPDVGAKLVDLHGLEVAFQEAGKRYATKEEAASVATADTAGVVKVGSDFDVASDGTISLYAAMAISSLTATPSQAERGSTVADVALKWSMSKVPASLTLDGAEVDPSLTSTAVEGANLTADKTYALKATDARGASATRNATVYFRDKRHWGEGSWDADALTDAALNGMSGELATSRAKTFSATAGEGEFIYYALPHGWGTPVFYVGGFEGGFELLKTFDHVNASGATVSYDVWRSSNAGLGATTVEVR